MRKKGESSFLGDVLVEGSARTAGRGYRELRDWYGREDDLQLTFKFITRWDH